MLSHSLIVEALEDNFVPVAIFNNTDGRDKQWLTKFKEPAWNYQVMRFVDPQLHDVIPRQDKVWSVGQTARRFAKALEKQNRDVPAYLSKVVIPETNPDAKLAVFAMYCFWTGEAKLGALDGVLTTEAGFYAGKEVVAVRYDPKVIDLKALALKAAELDCAHAIYLASEEDREAVRGASRLENIGEFLPKGYRRAPDSDQKKQINRQPALRKLGLTSMQWAKLNSRVVSGDSAEQWLSSRQWARLQELTEQAK